MSNEVAIIPRESEAQRMFAMIERMATDPQVDPAKLREILSVKQTWEADEARKMFARDMALFQSRCPIIAKADDAYGKKYARIDRIHRETRGLRKECGFWFTWQVCEIRDGMAFMEGLLGHNGGHTVPIKQVIPLPEELKGQNAAQRAGSAMTYAKRYGECLALDIVTGEDDDGNAAVGPGDDQGARHALFGRQVRAEHHPVVPDDRRGHAHREVLLDREAIQLAQVRAGQGGRLCGEHPRRGAPWPKMTRARPARTCARTCAAASTTGSPSDERSSNWISSS